MSPLSIARLIFDTVPQLYEASDGRYPVDLKIHGQTSRVFSLVPITDALRLYLERSVRIWEELSPMTEGEISQIIEREWIQQKFVVEWLEARTRVRSWGAVLDYARRLSRRLTEHQVMAKTLVIEPTDGRAVVRLSDPDFFKVFDWLGSSAHTYFRVNEHLEILSYEAIDSGRLREEDMQEMDGFRFYPGFLNPVIRSLKSEHSVVVHLSTNGSVLIADRNGLIASKRELESWTIYDREHVLASIAVVLGRQMQESECQAKPTLVALSLFQILFDIMMKMHGALIVIDEPVNLPAYTIKGIEKGADSPLGVIFSHSPANELLYSLAEVRKLVELSCIDGALVLDLHGNLVQVGSMVVAHPAVPNRFGTREAAAFSAAKHGATAFKISADGNMTLFFTLPEVSGSEVLRFDFR